MATLERVAGGILIREGLILLGKRSASKRSYPLVWHAIGGHCEVGESDEAALVRELREELGIVAVRYRSVGIFDEPEDLPVFRVHLFVVEAWEGCPTNCSGEHTTIEWHDPLHLMGIALASHRYRKMFAELASSL